jgi:hypothetical protein
MAPGTLVCLLHYLTTDTLHPHLPPLEALALLQAAEAYGLPRLGRLVEARLIREIDAVNVCGLLDVVHRYGGGGTAEGAGAASGGAAAGVGGLAEAGAAAVDGAAAAGGGGREEGAAAGGEAEGEADGEGEAGEGQEGEGAAADAAAADEAVEAEGDEEEAEEEDLLPAQRQARRRAAERTLARQAAVAVRAAPITRRTVRGGAWAALQAACTAFILRNHAAITAGEDWAALPEEARAAVEAAYSSEQHAYRFDALSEAAGGASGAGAGAGGPAAEPRGAGSGRTAS